MSPPKEWQTMTGASGSVATKCAKSAACETNVPGTAPFSGELPVP